MNKRSFYKLMVFIICAIILVAVYRLSPLTPRISESLQKINTAENLEVQQSENSQLPDTLQTETKQIIQNNLSLDESPQVVASDFEIEQLLNELEPHIYHEDPYIEAHSLINNLFMCTSEFTALEEEGDDFKRLTDKIDATSLANMKADCKTANTRYPTLLKQSDNNNLLSFIEPTTHEGRIIKESTKIMDLSQPQQFRDINLQRLKALLQTKIGALIAEAAMMNTLNFYNGEILPISQWLNSQDTDYNQQVSMFALVKMSCRYENGTACQAVGYNMMFQCLIDETACGLDFNTYYQQSIMPGMQKDVERLIIKFEAISEK